MEPTEQAPVPIADIDNDPEAFEQFFRDHARVCRRFLTLMFRGYGGGLVPPGVLDEVIEEEVDLSFVIARNHWSLYDPTKASVRTWLIGIGKNRVRRALEYHLRWVRRRADLEKADERPAADVSGGVVLRDAVANGLRRIEGRQAQALSLHYVEGRPVREVAGMLGTTEIAAQSLLQRGRHSFRRAWLEMEGNTEIRPGRQEP